jgi:hypothetical protein
VDNLELRAADANPAAPPRPEPVRRRGEPFFDQLVGGLYSPALVRLTLHQLVQDQYSEADRVHRLRGWGGAQPHGNDRYQYSKEQALDLSAALPGAEVLRPQGSLLYRIANAVVYPKRFGERPDDCPTTAQIEDSEIQRRLADGHFEHQPSLFDPDPDTPPTVVWLLFTGNHVDSGPLVAYLAVPGGRLPGGRVNWRGIEPLLSDGDVGPDDDQGAGDAQPPSLPPVPPEPSLSLNLLRA